MDNIDLDAPVYGDYPDDPRLPLITVTEAREVVHLLRVLATGTTGEEADARVLAGHLAARIPCE